MRARLNTLQFLALRSIAKEPWQMKWGLIRWKFRGRWFHLYRDGLKTPLDAGRSDGRSGYDDVQEKAWDAAWDLDGMGLVEVATIRCCPGTSCRLNDRHEFRLTPRGTIFLEKANAWSRRMTEARRTAEVSAASPVSSQSTGSTWLRKMSAFLPWGSSPS